MANFDFNGHNWMGMKGEKGRRGEGERRRGEREEGRGEMGEGERGRGERGEGERKRIDIFFQLSVGTLTM